MSKKPPKHSELREESTASRMKGFWGKRRPAVPLIPIRPERYLIVTEGTETEPNYFEEIRARINNIYHGQYVTVTVQGQGMNTLSLLERAKAIAEDDVDGFTQVWVVYDKDDFPSGDFNAVIEQCENTSEKGTSYHTAWSNESFELWFVLHFEYLQSALGRHAYIGKLSAIMQGIGLGAYSKNMKGMFVSLEPYVSTAIINAKKLETLNMGKSPALANPGTMVHKLVGELLPYTKRQS